MLIKTKLLLDENMLFCTRPTIIENAILLLDGYGASNEVIFEKEIVCVFVFG